MTPLTPKEQKVLSFLKAYTDRHGYPPTYNEIQHKFKYKAVSSAQQFVEQLTDKGYLKATVGQNRKRALELVSDDPADLISIPLEGAVAAGRLTEAVHNRDYVEIPRSLLKSEKDYFALRVKGDSMIEDCIMDGDLVVIKRQHSAVNGQTVVAIVGDEATIKRYYQRKSHIELHPANPSYEIIRVSNTADFKILGVLASVIRKLE